VSEEIITALRSAWQTHLESIHGDNPHPEARQHVWASGRRSCVRRMGLDLLYPGDDRGRDADAMERLQRGREREAAIIARLYQIGPRCTPPFEVVETQRSFRVVDRDGILLITGKMDLRLRFSRDIKPICEVKSGRTYERVEELEDLERSPWTRHALDQLLVYLLQAEEPWGFFIVDRPGMPLFLRVNLEDHLARAESFLVDARAAIDAAYGGPLPDYTGNPDNCKRCPHFGKTCAPPVGFGSGSQIIVDDELEALAEARYANEAAAKTFGHADDKLKKALRGVEMGILGRFMIEGKWQKGTKYSYPAEVKKQYGAEDPHHTFKMKFTPIPGPEGAAETEQEPTP